MTRTSPQPTLLSLFTDMDRLKWEYPEEALTNIRTRATGLFTPESINTWLLQQRSRGILFHDHVLRTDFVLHNGPRNDYDVRLRLANEPINANSKLRPWINAKGYWQLTFVISGGMLISWYFLDLDHIKDLTWFRHEYLTRKSEERYRRGSSFILSPNQVHRLEEIEASTLTLTIRVNRGASAYREFRREQSHFATVTRQPRERRVDILIDHLRQIA